VTVKQATGGDRESLHLRRHLVRRCHPIEESIGRSQSSGRSNCTGRRRGSERWWASAGQRRHQRPARARENSLLEELDAAVRDAVQELALEERPVRWHTWGVQRHGDRNGRHRLLLAVPVVFGCAACRRSSILFYADHYAMRRSADLNLFKHALCLTMLYVLAYAWQNQFG
jgi:hypothetical protein